MSDAELLKAIEAAYDYRGHVAIALKDGRTVEGFVFNRIKKSPRLPDGDYLDVMLKDSEERRRLRFAEIAGITMSGKNFAETFAEAQARQQAEKNKGLA